MTGDINNYELWTGLLGGLALFLFGMDIMTRALKRAAGDHLKAVLARLTRNRFTAVLTGTVITGVVNSSSVTTVILVGFISAGLMSMAQSVPVIMGANIGTTVTAQILAFKATNLSLPMIALGFAVSFSTTREDWREYGNILLGLGLVFFGMAVMGGAMAPLRTYQPFLDFMASTDSVYVAAAIGMTFTAVVQSSSATTGILIVMAGQGLMSLETAIAIALGANVGTCITAGLAAIGKPREAVRAAAVHVLFNVAGVLIWIGFVPELAQLARDISPQADDLTGVARAAAEAPRQIANIHTFFNVINTLIFLGFTTQIARLVEWLIPDRPLRTEDLAAPKYLDDNVLSTPAIALENARLEIVRLGERVRIMLEEIMPAVLGGRRIELTRVAAMDRGVDALHRAIVGYLGKISVQTLSPVQSDKLMRLIQMANDLEHVGDRIATDMVTSTEKRLDEGVTISSATADMIRRFHQQVLEALTKAIVAVGEEDIWLATQVRRMKQDMSGLAEDVARHEVQRLVAAEPRRLETYAREVELMEILDGIFKIARRIARTQLADGEAGDMPTKVAAD